MGVSSFNSSVSSVGFSFNAGKANSNISKFQATAKAPSFKPELLTFEDKIEKVSNIEENDSLGEKIAKTAVDVGCTYVVAMTSVYSGYKKFEERITDGIVNAGTGLISGILHIVGNDAAAKSVEEWGMDYIAVDQVAEANKMFYEGTEIGKFINNNSYMKYDSKTAQGIQTVTEKVTFVAAATALTVASGGAAAAGMGAVYGMGESAESHYQADDRGNYWDLKNVGGIAIDSALSAAEAYGAGQMGATAINAAGSFSQMGFNGAKELAREKLSNFSMKAAVQTVKSQSGTIAKNAALQTFKDKDFYIDTATTIAGDVKTGITTGEWDIGHMVGSTAASYGTNFLGNLAGGFGDAVGKNKKIAHNTDIEMEKNIFANGNESDISAFRKNKYEEMFGSDNVTHNSGIDIAGNNGSVIQDGVDKLNASADRTGLSNYSYKGKTYDNLSEVCKKHGISEVEYYQISEATPGHLLSDANKKTAIDIRMELTADVTDANGRIVGGTSVSKYISAEDFNNYYQNGNTASVGGCVALTRDVDDLLDAEEAVNYIGLRYDESNFIDGSGNPRKFYLVEGQAAPDNEIYVRIASTADHVGISDSVMNQFNQKYPGKKYNGYDLNANKGTNESYVNEIWTRHVNDGVDQLSDMSNIPKDKIVTEEARWYNSPTNPDRGTGLTNNQAIKNGKNIFGTPEFYTKTRSNVSNGNIYEINGNQKTIVGKIDEFGVITLF